MCEFVCVCVSAGAGSGWMVNRINDGFNVYFNVDTMQHLWHLPDSVTLDPSLLTRDDIQVALPDSVTLDPSLLTCDDIQVALPDCHT